MQDGHATKHEDDDSPKRSTPPLDTVDPFDLCDEIYLPIRSLCEEVQTSFPDSLGENAWYLVLTSTLIASGQPDAIYPVFKYLFSSSKSGSNSGQLSSKDVDDLSNRLKDVLMKEWTLIGIPLVISAVPHLARATAHAYAASNMEIPSRLAQEEKSHYFPKQTDFPTEKQGYAFMDQIYLHNLPSIMSTWGPHQIDFEWLEKRVIYGLFLSDHTILTPLEAELVTLSSIMVSGLRTPTMWHVRGLMRMGLSEKDTEKVCDAVKKVAKWAGKEGTDKWIWAWEVDPEMPEEDDGRSAK